jgi:hypothetical protein
LSKDDRFEEIRRLLDSTVSEFQSLFQSAGGFEDSRVGNGWDPEQIAQEVYFLQPKPEADLTKMAQERKRSLFRNRVFSFLKPLEREVQLLGKPILKFVPFWVIKGFHECFYFRGGSYKIDLPEDVVAVELEGKIRDLAGRESSDTQSLANLTRRLLGRRESGGARFFRLNDVTELAYMYREGSFFVNAEGKEDLEAEAFFEGELPLEATSPEQLAKQFPDAKLSPSLISKEELIRRLHASIVRPPATFSRILSNRFQITTLVEYLMPVFSFTFESRGQRKEVLLQGFTGGIFQ